MWEDKRVPGTRMVPWLDMWMQESIGICAAEASTCRKVLGILPGAKMPAAKSAFPVILGQGCWWVSTAGDASWRRDSTYRPQTESLKQKTPWEPEWTRRN